MKANETPKRIWIDPATDLPKLSGHIDKDSVEYTRTDALIEKAENYLRNKCQRFILTEKDIEDFVNYMKGE